MKEFKGKTAFVTGAASGIGLALTRTFLDRGMNVMMADVEQAALDTAVHGLSNYGDRVGHVVADVSIGENLYAAAERAIKQFGKVHVLCNNAGVSRPGALATMSLRDWEWVIGVNLYGTIHGIRAFLPHMKAHGEASHIINTSSIAGVIPGALGGTYAATKFGIIGISEVLRDELKDTPIGVSVLCPGWTKTNMFFNGRNRPDRFGGAFDVFTDPQLTERNKQYRDAGTTGLDPLDLAALVIRAIEENEFYIFTQPDQKTGVANRSAEIMRAFDAAAGRLADIVAQPKAPPAKKAGP
jgi:NAD(P)-dependent dehydrogenase (short-subunit alcohol dehydrogenase family)